MIISSPQKTINYLSIVNSILFDRFSTYTHQSSMTTDANSKSSSPTSSAIITPKSAFARLCRKLSPKRAGQIEVEVEVEVEVETLTSSIRGNHHHQQQLLRRVFDYFDEDGDGKISPAELQSCVRAAGGHLSMEEAETAVQCSDMDGDGLLGLDEFQKLMETSGEEEKNRELRDAFGMYEMDGSGCITPASLRRMLGKLGDSRSLDDCKAMIQTFDLNGDGVLSFDEFALMMR